MGRQIKLKNNLTPRQFIFVKSLLKGNSGLQSALRAYNTTDPNVAKVIASQNLRKLNIKEYIREVLNSHGLSVSALIENLRQIAFSRPESINSATKLEANIELLKLWGVYHPK